MITAPHHLNARLLKQLKVFQRVLLVVPALIAVTILLGWLSDSVSSFLPDGWALMKANTAACVMLSVCAMLLSYYHTQGLRLLISRFLGGLVLLLAGTALVGHITGLTFPLDTLLASDDLASVPGRMSTQSALFFSMLGMSAICEGKQRPFCTLLRDLLSALLISLLLTVIAGYLFGASELFVQAEDIRTSPQTLVCMTCLTGALLIIRMHHGYFAILAGVGIGSQIARGILPVVVLLPFLIISGSVWLSEGKGFSAVLASSLTAASSAAILFVMLIWLSQKINAMESELRDISLIDELTRINNRRGFYLLGEHMLFEAQRDGRPVTVLFFDLDGLKELNDSQGHDIGSDLLKHFASLLRDHFRKSDVVARLGGDEFAVVSSSGDSQIAVKRLERIINAINKAGKRPYSIRYSVGEATYTSDSPITDFNELVSTADERMYESKRNKKANLRAKTITPTRMTSTAS